MSQWFKVSRFVLADSSVDWAAFGVEKAWLGDRLIYDVSAQVSGAWPEQTECPIGWDERDARI